MTSSQFQDHAIHILCAADNNYGPYAGILMQSAMRSTKKSSIHFHLLSDGIRADDVGRCKAVANKYNNKLTVYEISDKLSRLPENLKFANHISRSSYSRIFFSDFLDPEIVKIVYLDCDVICQRDLSELWALFDHVSLIGAVRDPWLDNLKELKLSLDIDPTLNYFNAGVLMINVVKWKEIKAEQLLFNFIVANRHVKNADQDAINAVFSSEITPLPEVWNTMINLPDASSEKQAHSKAGILHYVGGFKPWHVGYSIMNFRKSRPFMSAKRQSPWKNKFPDMQLKRIVRKLTNR